MLQRVQGMLAALLALWLVAPALSQEKNMRVGIIGLDTSHAVAFTQALNAAQPRADLAGCRVVAAFPQGSPDIESSVKRVPEYTAAVRELGVEIVPSLDELLRGVDAVLLETNDGRPHLAQALPVIKAGKPLFIDKPVAGSLADAVALFAAAEQAKTPVFTSSALRFASGTQKLRRGEFGAVLGCDAFSPAPLEPTHPDLFWYGIHGVETLFTVMGPGCESVTRTHTAEYDVVVGRWNDGRLGTFRGTRQGTWSYGGTAFTAKGPQPAGGFEGYEPLLVEIVKFFRTGTPPVSAAETLELYAFMEAADESKRQGGASIKLAQVLDQARRAAPAK